MDALPLELTDRIMALASRMDMAAVVEELRGRLPASRTMRSCRLVRRALRGHGDLPLCSPESCCTLWELGLTERSTALRSPRRTLCLCKRCP